MSKWLREKYPPNTSPIYPCRLAGQIVKLSKSGIRICREVKPKQEGYIAVDNNYGRVRNKRYLCPMAVPPIKTRPGDDVAAKTGSA